MAGEEPKIISPAGDVECHATINNSGLAFFSIEVSPTLDSMGVAMIIDLSDDISGGSNSGGHDVFFRLPKGFIPHQQVYYNMLIAILHPFARTFDDILIISNRKLPLSAQFKIKEYL